MEFDINIWVRTAAYASGGIAMGFGAIGAAIGEGFTAGYTNSAISENSEISGNLFKSMLVGQAVCESAGIFALVVSILVIFTDFAATPVKMAALIGAGVCMGLGALGSGIGSGFPAAKCSVGMAKQPEMAGRLITNMLIGSAICQTPAIFAMVTSLMLMLMDFGDSPIKIAGLIGAGICMGFGAIGSGIGSGLPAGEVCIGIARQPALASRLVTNMLIGSAICQTPAIFAMVIALMLMLIDFGDAPLKAAGLIGAGICMGFGAIGSGVGSGFPAAQSTIGAARQPEMSGRLITNMLIGSAVCQTPAIFAMVVALMLMFVGFPNAPLYPTWAAFIGAGISTGFAAIGSGIGGGMAAGASCEGIARHPRSVGNVITIMLVGQAVAQTPSIFGLLVSFILLFKSFPESATLSAAMALLGAGISMGFGGIGPGIGNGMAAQGAVKWVSRNLDHAGDLMRTMLVGQAVSQSTAIYAMVISLVLIFVV
jgi:ATP synthase F0 subunit c